MSPLRRLFVAALALAGALSWGPPAVVAVCLRGGVCATAGTRSPVEAPSCCRKAPESGPSVAPEAPEDDCCGCCTSVRVGMGIDGPVVRVETPVPPPAPAASAIAFEPPAAFVVPAAAPPAPRAPPEKVLPLRI
jgi:hypothetical protein